MWAVLGPFSVLCSSTPYTVVLLTTQWSRWHNSNFTNENTEQQDISFLSQDHKTGRWGHQDVHCVRKVQQKKIKEVNLCLRLCKTKRTLLRRATRAEFQRTEELSTEEARVLETRQKWPEMDLRKQVKDHNTLRDIVS